jgi:hypothetical protein
MMFSGIALQGANGNPRLNESSDGEDRQGGLRFQSIRARREATARVIKALIREQAP